MNERLEWISCPAFNMTECVRLSHRKAVSQSTIHRSLSLAAFTMTAILFARKITPTACTYPVDFHRLARVTSSFAKKEACRVSYTLFGLHAKEIWLRKMNVTSPSTPNSDRMLFVSVVFHARRPKKNIYLIFLLIKEILVMNDDISNSRFLFLL